MIIIEEKYKNHLNNHTFIDLFAGIGAFHLALKSYGASCVFSSEWDTHAQSIYQKNFGKQPAGDITQIKETDIPPHHILCAGFPCQAFSISGKQLGFQDTRGTLFFDIARIVDHHQPNILFLENVKHLSRHDKGKTLKIILSSLKELGYTVFYDVLNASHFGVPQKRERIYILGFHKSLNITTFNFPQPTDQSIKLKDILQKNGDTTNYIINRPDTYLKQKPLKSPSFFNHTPAKPIRIGTVNKGGQGERIYDINGHAITLSAYGGGVGAKTGLYYIDNAVRKLTPRECARLMGFPEEFIIHSSNNQAYKQFGNSVVVNVLQHIILAMIKQEVFATEKAL